MNELRYKKAFTLIEALAAMAIVLTLISAVSMLGQYLKTSGAKKLTESAIGVAGIAADQYKSVHGDFPPQIDSSTDLDWPVAVSLTQGSEPTDPAQRQRFWQSSSLYLCLDQTPQSRVFIDNLATGLTTNKDRSGVKLLITIPADAIIPAGTYDFVRMVDAWGTDLRYEYTVGDPAPRITSAGPDKDFNTTGDNITNY